MKTRLELQDALEALLGSRNVYFQPPENVKMKYPCIVYHKTPGWQRHADNEEYHYHDKYELTVIDKNPDSLLPEKVRKLQLCRYDRHYVSDNMYHDTFELYW